MNWTNVSYFCDSFPVLSECPLLPLVPCTCMMAFEQHFILPSPGGKVTCPEFQLILLSTLILAIWSSAADQGVNKCEYIYLAVMPDTLFAFWQDLRGLRLLCGSDGKESACRRPGFNPWVRKIPYRREWLPTPVFLLEKIPRIEESGRLESMRSQRVRYIEQQTLSLLRALSQTLKMALILVSSIVQWGRF